MIILGIDPGIATTGFGVIQKSGNRLVPIEWGAILTKPDQPLAERLFKLSTELTQIIAKHQPNHMSVEELFFNTNAKTALIVGQARGVILLAGAAAGLPVASYTPGQVKTSVSGYGKADKNQVQQMVKHILSLEKIPKPDDVADALALAICHAHSYHPSRVIRQWGP